ncbi:class I SAM-dependent methyltransferase [Pseudogemmobacter sonorensis]|uniref:class I SAM-dependent methyltransferase n=1 Tax=Pseudogemmobacter sonorensis TaxID=2989681 RepID=UPI0036795615
MTPRASRLELALDSGLFDLPPEGRIAVFRPMPGEDLSALPKERVTVLTGWRPAQEHFQKLGFETEVTGPHAMAVVCMPRAREHARALLAEAAGLLPPGAPVVVDGQKTDGVDAMLKELRGHVALSEALAKAHGKIAVFRAGPELAGWAAALQRVEGGFITRPGVFSADGPDRGSVLLAGYLPEKLGPKIVDLGAGWGYLSCAVLARAGVKRLDLVEAERDALDCARENVVDDRARFHWVDALSFRPESLVETVVTNPPFHAGRNADPALGAAFIAAARRMMAPDGQLWMVANRHLPYDPVLAEHFLEFETVFADSAFRVVRAVKPRRRPR